MRLLRWVGAAVVVVVSIWVGPSAGAKGPTGATIEGPGIATPVEVAPHHGSIGGDLAALIDDSEILTGLWCGVCDERLRHRPTDRLGARYTVSYEMGLDGRDGSADRVVEYLFPDAAPGPVAYVPADQRFWGRSETVGGWFLVRPRIRHVLSRLGVPIATAARAQTRTVAEAPVVRARSRVPLMPVVFGALALGALMVVVVARSISRRSLG